MKEEIEGITYLEFETFMKVNLRVGRILSVEDHPNADKLYVVRLDDGTDDGRTICAGLKAYYEPEEMEGNWWSLLKTSSRDRSGASPPKA